MSKIIPMAIAGGLLVASGGVAGGYQAYAKDVDLSVDGNNEQVTLFGRTVEDVLKDKGVQLKAGDRVVPDLTQAIQDGTAIKVDRSRPLSLVVDGKKIDAQTVASNVQDAIKDLDLPQGSVANLPGTTPIGLEGIALNVTTGKPVTFTIGNQKFGPFQLPARTVGEAVDAVNRLNVPGLKVTKDVKVNKDLATPLTGGPVEISLEVTTHKDTTKKAAVDYKTVRKESTSLDEGETKVETKGVKGEAVQTWRESFVNGKSTGSKKIKENVTKKPTDEVILIGAKAKPASSDDDSGSSSSSSSKPKSNDSGSSSSTSPATANTCGASFYDEGQMTASGERFNPNAMTAAHKSLPLGSKVKVTNPKNGKTVIVRINDRGPYVSGRCLDLSRAAFSAIGNTGAGHMTVKWERI